MNDLKFTTAGDYMNEVSDQEKEELVDAIKGPRYYRVQLSGYGGEAAYMSISKEAHDFWKPIKEEHGDGDLVHYMVNAEDGDFEFDEISSVPPEADFLKSEYEGEVYHSSWYDSSTEFEHTYGVTYDSAWITVDEVADDEYNSGVVAEVIEQEQVTDLVERIGEETDWEVEINEYTTCDEHADVEYIAQMYSSEKGCFFDGVIETVGDFDPHKLKITATEFLNGEDTITSIEYDGVEVDNMGGDTNGKGYYADVWKQ